MNMFFIFFKFHGTLTLYICDIYIYLYNDKIRNIEICDSCKQ